MADIELVIKIPEGLKKDFELEQWTALSCMEMKNALINSTPLPKGHGKLIDADALDKIIAEIEEIETYDGIYIDRFYVLQILDKCKEESEAQK